MLDIGGAINQGITGYRDSVKYNDERQARQQQLTQQAEAFKMQQEQFKSQQANSATSLEVLQEQLKATQAQNKEISAQITKQNLYKAFDGGTLSDINQVIKTDKGMQNLFPGLDSIDKINPDDTVSVNKSNGMANPAVATSIRDGKIVKDVIDLDAYKIRTGYSTYKLKRDNELSKLQLESQSTGILATDMNKAVDWLKQNPTKTYAEYQNTVAVVDTKTEAEIAKLRAETYKINKEANQVGKVGPANATDMLNMMKLNSAIKDEVVQNYVYNNFDTYAANIDGKPGDKVDIGGKELSVLEVATKVQGDAKLEATERQMLTGYHDAHKAFSQLKTELQDPKMNWDAMSKGMEELAKYDPADFMKMTPKEKEALANKFNFNSKLRTAMGSYIKAMSGAAVSDEEREFYTTTMTAGNWSNKEAATASLSGFITGLERSYKNRLEPLKTTYPRDYVVMNNLMETPAKVDNTNKSGKSKEELAKQFGGM